MDEVVQDLAKNAKIVDGKLSYTGSTPHQASVQIGDTSSSNFPEELLLHFEPEQLVISKQGKEQPAFAIILSG